MPTILSHVAVPLALGIGLGRELIVLRSELLWIWLPAMAGAALLMTARFLYGRRACIKRRKLASG